MNETKSLRIPAKGRAPDTFSLGRRFVRHEAPSGADFQKQSRKKVMWYWNIGIPMKTPVFIGFAGLLQKVILSNEKGNVSVSD